MRRFSVEFSDRAIGDLESSFEWGCSSWGVEQAATWYIEISDEIEEKLSLSPLGYPVAPENDEYLVEVRQMNVGRYHIIYNVTGTVVTVLHIRGPYR